MPRYSGIFQKGKSVTVVVASATSLNKNQADFVCDGTADDVQIQAAIDSLPTATVTNGGGTIEDAPQYLTSGINAVDVTGLGTLTIVLPTGVTGTAASDVATVDNSPVSLVAGSQSITTSGVVGNINITIDGAVGGKVVLLEGQYNLASNLELISDLEIEGSGTSTVLKKTVANNTNHLFSTNAGHLTNVYMHDMKFDGSGNAIATLYGDGGGCWVAGTLTVVYKFRFERIWGIDPRDAGFTFTCHGLIIKDCILSTTYSLSREPIVVSGSDFVITGNIIENTADDNAISLTHNSGSTEATRMVVSNNVIRNVTAGYAIDAWTGNSGRHVSNVAITGNTMNNVDGGVSITSSSINLASNANSGQADVIVDGQNSSVWSNGQRIRMIDDGSDEWAVISSYTVAGNGTITNGTGIVTGSPVTVISGVNSPVVTQAGTFTVNLPVGVTGTAVTGGWIVTGSPVALVAGNNAITVEAGGSGTITVNLFDLITLTTNLVDNYTTAANARIEAEGSKNIIISGNHIEGRGSSSSTNRFGIFIESGAVAPIVVSNNTLNLCYAGIQSRAEDVIISNNSIYLCRSSGIDLEPGGHRTQIINNVILDSKEDIDAGASVSGIRTVHSNNIVIRGNYVRDSRTIKQSNYGINFYGGTSVNCIVENNDCSNGGTTGNIHLTGSGHILRNNLGYVTEASSTGTIDNGMTSEVITHSLGDAVEVAGQITPTIEDITITLGESASNDPGDIWVGTFTSTQFTVNCRNNPGVNNLDFGWKAKIDRTLPS